MGKRRAKAQPATAQQVLDGVLSFTAETFNHDAVKDLQRQGGVTLSDEDTDSLRQSLIHTARLWRWHNVSASKEGEKQVRKARTLIGRAARTIQAQLEGLDGPLRVRALLVFRL